MANEKDLLQNTGMNEAKEDGNRAEKSQESEGKILHNVNDIMDQLMAYGDAVNDAAFSELLEKLPEEDTKKTFAPGEPKNSMMARMMASSMERGDVQAYINMGKAAVANVAQAEARKAVQPVKNKPTFGERISELMDRQATEAMKTQAFADMISNMPEETPFAPGEPKASMMKRMSEWMAQDSKDEVQMYLDLALPKDAANKAAEK